MRPIKKTIYTLNIDYSEKITAITYPLIYDYAEKIGAEVVIIKDRKFPAWPVVYEKLQIYELGKDNDWNIYIDGDVIINPDFFDLTVHLTKDTVLQYGSDLAGNRWKYDRFFLRDGRHISSCNWFTIASDLCIDLWKPLDEKLISEAVVNITTVIPEKQSGIIASHLIDDYALSRNIAKYGLKYTTCKEILKRIQPDNPGNDNYLYHRYLCKEEDKVASLKERLKLWGLSPWYFSIDDYAVKCSVL